jgi:hypothetical protein
MRKRIALLAALAVSTACKPTPEQAPQRLARTPRPGERITMAALHQAGGVPPSWRFRIPPGDAAAGRHAFVELGCPSCHQVAGEAFSHDAPTGIGPDLTGMGGHHPPEYFAESILDPDAVLVDGPGYIGPDGRSIMPSYPDLTLAQLADLVAYLRGLRAGAGAEMAAAVPMKRLTDVPAPPPQPASIFYVQSYEVEPGQLAEFEAWFRSEGASALLAYDGVVAIDTWVDITHSGPPVTTVIGFRDEASLTHFLDAESATALGLKFDEFIGRHLHRVFRGPPIFRSPTLSAP